MCKGDVPFDYKPCFLTKYLLQAFAFWNWTFSFEKKFKEMLYLEVYSFLEVY